MEDAVPYPLKVLIHFALDKLTQVLFSSYSLPFWVKEKANRLKNEIREVEELDNWHPAVPLMHTLFPAGGLKDLQRIV